LHHAAVDGIAAGEVFTTLLDICSEKPSAVTELRKPAADSLPSRATLAVRGLASLPITPARAILYGPRSLAHLDQVPALRSLPGIHTVSRIFRGDLGAKRLDAPKTRFNTQLSAGRSVAFGTVSLTDVKKIRNEFAITVNDVVIAACAGALRRRLTASGGLPADPLVAYMPVSTRLPDAKDRYGNAISSIVAPIPTHLSDPRARLAFTHETLDVAKDRAREAPPTLLNDVNAPIPVPMFGIAARGLMDVVSSRWMRPPVNLIISNVPGSPVGLACCGAPLLANYPMSVIFDGFALNITVVSYQDGLDIGILGDAQALPDAWDLMSDIRHELAELSSLVTTERSSH
jgi:WS/DGAT/MGAT family acyltransferase